MPGTMSLRGRGMMMPSFLSGRLGAYDEIGAGWFGFTYKRDILSWGPLVRLEPIKMYEATGIMSSPSLSFSAGFRVWA